MVRAGGRKDETPGLRLIKEGIEKGFKPPIAKFIGFELTKVGRGSAVVEMEVGPQHSNPMGTLHGGIICDVADAAMGIAYASLLNAAESFTTMELKVNFLRPVWTGRIVARASVMKKGRSTGLVVCKVDDQEKRLVAFATSTCTTVPGAPGRGLVRENKPAPTR
jgi:uncharacterized protein (TIGR00369 family)